MVPFEAAQIDRERFERRTCFSELFPLRHELARPRGRRTLAGLSDADDVGEYSRSGPELERIRHADAWRAPMRISR